MSSEIIRFSQHTKKMVACCLLGGESMKRGVSAIRDAHIPNFVETEEAFRAIGKSLASKYSKPR